MAISAFCLLNLILKIKIFEFMVFPLFPQTRKYLDGCSPYPILLECLEIPNAETSFLPKICSHTWNLSTLPG